MSPTKVQQREYSKRKGYTMTTTINTSQHEEPQMVASDFMQPVFAVMQSGTHCGLQSATSVLHQWAMHPPYVAEISARLECVDMEKLPGDVTPCASFYIKSIQAIYDKAVLLDALRNSHIPLEQSLNFIDLLIPAIRQNLHDDEVRRVIHALVFGSEYKTATLMRVAEVYIQHLEGLANLSFDHEFAW